MDESKLEDIQQMSIGSLAGVLSDLNQNDVPVLKDLPLKELETLIVEFRNTKMRLYQIQKYKFNFNQPTLSVLVDIVNKKLRLALEVIEKQNNINQQFLLDYHKYEKNMINLIQDAPKQNNDVIEELEDKVVDWYKSVTIKFNEITSLKIFNTNELNVIYNEDFYTKFQNQQNLTFLQKGLFKNCAQAAIEEYKNMLNKFSIQHSEELQGIMDNLQILDQFYKAQQLIEDMIDFLSSKLMFDITQVIKNSLINIDKITNYLNKMNYRFLVRQQNTEFRQYESKEQQTLFLNMFQQIKYFKYPKTIQEHQVLDEQFNDLNKQLHVIIQKNIEMSDYPKAIQRNLKKLYEYFFKGNRKFIKLKIRYIKIAQQFEDTLDKQELLNQNVLAELQTLQAKSNTLHCFMTGLFEMGEFCLSCYDLAEEVHNFLFQVQLLIHHYSETLRVIGASKQTNLGQRPRIRKIFEPYPEEEKAVLGKKYQLLQVKQTGSSKQIN
ncbi:unnamed protein product [Paramecium octaurelia]|uniref:Uncharacterized protein n=1 Tax=Paramecium octaurelia TaxID=43137 RepID=A0A8S1TLJ1_PAROT|nr:unnamed protein product [Paramecium octaurelia]